MLPLRDKVKSRTRPYVVYFLIVSCLIVFIYEITLSYNEIVKFFFEYGVVPAFFASGEIWQQRGFFEQIMPLFTSMFLHSGWSHIIGNLWILWIFGDNVQDRMGPLRFSLFYSLSGIAAMSVHAITNWGGMIPTIGASGSIAGVMGAYLVFFPRARVLTLVPFFFYFTIIQVPAFVFLLAWFGLQFFNGTFSLLAPTGGAGVAWWAHVGGFAFGMITAKLFQKGAFPPVDINIVARKGWK